MIFDSLSYRQVIKMKLKENSGIVGYKTKLSKAMGIQISHFNFVLSEKIDLKNEQGFLLCFYWGLNRSETDYFLTLLELERALNPQLKEYYQHRLEEIRRSRLSESLKRQRFSNFEERISMLEMQVGYLLRIEGSLKAIPPLGA